MIAEKIRDDEQMRYVQLSPIEKMDEFQWMENFSHFVDDDSLREELQKILDVTDKINRVNELLNRHPEERTLWLVQFSSERSQQAAEFLAEHGVEDGKGFRFRWE